MRRGLITLRTPQVRIRTIVLAVNLVAMLVPLSSIYVFRLYENALVRQTETELIAQGAFVSALFRQQLKENMPETWRQSGRMLPLPVSGESQPYLPVAAQIVVATAAILPPRAEAKADPNPPGVAAMQAARHIVPVLEEARRTTLAAVSLMDGQGIVLNGMEAGMSLAHVPEVAQAMEGRYAAALRQRVSDSPVAALSSLSRNTVFRVFVAYPIIEDGALYGVLLLSRSPRNVLKAVYEERSVLLPAAAAVVLSVLLISLLTSRAISQPVQALLLRIQRIARGEVADEVRMAPSVTWEIAELSAQIEEMARQLQERTDSLRQFALYVSHEFKTPLTSIRGALELLSDHEAEMSAGQRQRFICNTLADTQRLHALMTRMLELARAEAGEVRHERVDVASIMHRLAERYRHQGIEVCYTAEHGPLVVPLSEDVAETILGNLLENSIQHQANRILVVSRLVEKCPVLVVSDNGAGVSPANAAQLFTPFFTTRRTEGGTGLGLAIIRALLKASGADITLIAAQPHAVFQIRFARILP